MSFKKSLIFLLFFVFLLFPSYAAARIGVGVATGKIHVDEKLKPGVIYTLPSLTVLNTGDEEGTYQVGINYHEQQPEKRPPKTWFIFTPQTFTLQPGGSQVVDIKLNLPLKTEPGDYFAYLEASPKVKAAEGGTTSIGIAAATKLYFTLVPANPVLAVYYKLASFWKVYYPWPQRVSIGVAAAILLILIKRFLHIEINLKKEPKEPKEHKESKEPKKTDTTQE